MSPDRSGGVDLVLQLCLIKISYDALLTSEKPLFLLAHQCKYQKV